LVLDEVVRAAGGRAKAMRVAPAPKQHRKRRRGETGRGDGIHAARKRAATPATYIPASIDKPVIVEATK
jgi:hypothetical protein